MAVDVKRKLDVLTTLVSRGLGITGVDLHQSFGPASSADIPEIMALRHKAFSRSPAKDTAIITWKYFSTAQHSNSLYVLRLNGKIIAKLGMLPIQLLCGDKKTAGVMLGDIVVHPDYEKIGLGGWMLTYAQTHNPVAMTMHGNADSDPTLKKLFKSVNCRTELKYVFCSRYYFAARHWPVWIAAVIDTSFFRLFSRLRVGRLPRFPKTYRVAELSSSDYCSAVDHRAANVEQLNIVHDQAFLHWRFDCNPVSTFKHIVVYRASVIRAFAIIKFEPSWQRGFGGFLMDWRVLDSAECDERVNSDSLLKMLFGEILRCCLRQKSDFLSVMTTDSGTVAILQSLGLSVRDSQTGFYIHANQQNEVFYSENNWKLTYADTEEVL